MELHVNLPHPMMLLGNMPCAIQGHDSWMHLQVADFGLSRILSAESISTGTYGTVTHMPPELLTTGEVTPTDICPCIQSSSTFV